MAKDSYWFKHDSTASRDLKMMKLKAIYGHFGIGLFWCLVEVLREQNHYRWSDDEASLQILAKIIDCDLPKFNGFITDCKRIDLIKSDGKHIYSQRLIDDMVTWESKKKNRLGTKTERIGNGIGTKTEDKNNKNNKNNKTLISNVKHQQFIKELLSDQNWCEIYVAKRFSLENATTKVEEWLINFESLIGGRMDLKETKEDFASHFVAWMGKQNLTNALAPKPPAETMEERLQRLKREDRAPRTIR